MPQEEYTIIVSGERFVFTRDQLESEPGNYFATYFFGDFKEASEGVKEMEIHRDPILFKIIQLHLQGYVVVPLPDKYCPYMTLDNLIYNLMLDVNFFGLTRLKGLLSTEVTKSWDDKAPMPWDQFVKAMNLLGFKEYTGSQGSRVTFHPPDPKDKAMVIHKPHPDPTISPIFLKQIALWEVCPGV